MTYVMKCEGVAGLPNIRTFDGMYLEWVDFEGAHGRGLWSWTPNPGMAKKFETAAEALELWKMQSKTVPLRPDGRPNRPLTCFTVSVEATHET